MTDRKLLEAAANAAGLAVGWRDSVQCLCYSGSPYNVAWNPLAEDGDAFRLAVDLNFAVEVSRETGTVYVGGGCASVTESVPEGSTDAAWRDATRRAIVRAAAAVAGVGSFSAA